MISCPCVGRIDNLPSTKSSFAETVVAFMRGLSESWSRCGVRIVLFRETSIVRFVLIVQTRIPRPSRCALYSCADGTATVLFGCGVVWMIVTEGATPRLISMV